MPADYSSRLQLFPIRRFPAGSDPVRVYAVVNDAAAQKGHLRIALRGADGRRHRQWTERTVRLPDIDAPFEVSPKR